MKTYKIQYTYEVAGTISVRAGKRSEAKKIVEEMLENGLEFNDKRAMEDDIAHKNYFTF